MSISRLMQMGAAGVPTGGVEYLGHAYNDEQANNVVFGSSAISGVQSGDILIVTLTDDLSSNYQLPSGWTSGFNFNAFQGTSAQALFYKTASSSDTSVTITRGTSNSSPKNNAVMMAFRGCTVGNIATTSPTISSDPPSVSVSSTGIVLAGFGYQDELTTPTVTGPTGYNFIGNFNSSITSPVSRQQGLAVAYSDPLSSGSEDPSAFSTTGSPGNFFYAFSVELETA